MVVPAKPSDDRRAHAGERIPRETAGGGIARLAVERARAGQIDVQPLLRQAKLTARTLADPKERIPVARQIAFLKAVSERLGDEDLGFQLAREADLREIGLIYYVAASSDNLERAFNHIQRYCRITNESIVVRTSFRPDWRIEVGYSGVARHTDRHQIEFVMTALVRLCRELTGRLLSPSRVAFAHVRSRHRAQYQRFLGCPVEFGTSSDVIVFPVRVRSLPVLNRDSHLNRILLDVCEQALGARRSTLVWRIRVENAIGPLLPHGEARLRTIAEALGVSPRTLARRLADEGTTFSVVLDNMRHELATYYIGHLELPLSQIAWLLGFADSSAFTHAFRRWTGQAPRDARADRLRHA